MRRLKFLRRPASKNGRWAWREIARTLFKSVTPPLIARTLFKSVTPPLIPRTLLMSATPPNLQLPRRPRPEGDMLKSPRVAVQVLRHCMSCVAETGRDQHCMVLGAPVPQHASDFLYTSIPFGSLYCTRAAGHLYSSTGSITVHIPSQQLTARGQQSVL